MVAALTGRVNGAVIELDAPLPDLKGQRVHVVIEPVIEASVDARALHDAWQAWVWLELLLDGVKGAHTGTRIVPMVDAYTERLGAPPPSSDAALRASLQQVDSDGSGPRRILGRIPAERREALVEGIPFNLYVGPTHPNGHLPYFRQGWHFCDLAPTPRLAERAAASLAHFFVSETLQPRERAALDQQIVEGLARRMGAYGEAGRAALAAVAPQAKCPVLLQAVVNAWGHGLA